MSKGYTLAIVGARTFNDKTSFEGAMETYVAKNGFPSLVVSGGAMGADTLGENWAKANDIPTKIYKPDWSKFGKAAGILRNTDIVAACDKMVAFPSATGKGTQDSIRKAKEAGKEVAIVNV